MRGWQGLAVGGAIVMLVTVARAEIVNVTLKVDGMTTTGCSSPLAIQGTTTRLPGVRGASVSLERGEMTVEYERDECDLEKLISTVERMCLVRITRPSSR